MVSAPLVIAFICHLWQAVDPTILFNFNRINGMKIVVKVKAFRASTPC